jgi:DNA-binding response OmpR family regulator
MATILIAETASAVTDPMAEALRLAGHQALVARDGDQAWRIAQLFHIELLITDRQLPGLSGDALIERLRQEPTYARLPVIIISAGELPPTTAVWLAKPVVLSHLHRLVHDLVPADPRPAQGCAG